MLQPTALFETSATTREELPELDGAEHRKDVHARDLGNTLASFLGRPRRLGVTVSLLVLVHGLGFWTVCLAIGRVKEKKDRC